MPPPPPDDYLLVGTWATGWGMYWKTGCIMIWLCGGCYGTYIIGW